MNSTKSETSANGIAAGEATKTPESVDIGLGPFNYPYANRFFHDSCEPIIQLLKLYGLLPGPYIAKEVDRSVVLWARHAARLHHLEHVHHVDACLKVMKYKLCAFFSWATNSELPPPMYVGMLDSPGSLFGGRIYRWLRSLKNEAQTRFYMKPKWYEWFGLAQSIKLSKRAMPRPSRGTALRALVKTYRKLTSEPIQAPFPDMDFSWLDEFIAPTNHETVMNLYRYFIRSVMSKLDLTRTIYSNVRGLSRSATFIQSRSKVGELGEILLENRGGDVVDQYPLGTAVPIWSSQISDRRLRADYDGTYSVSAYHFMMNHLIDDFNKDFQDVWCQSWPASLNPDYLVHKEKMHVSILAPIIESLKVRSISKGSGSCVAFLKDEQDRMRRYLTGFEHFCVGKDVTCDIISFVGFPVGDEKFLSVDYEDSTNNLHREFSQVASEEIFDTCHVDPLSRYFWSETLYGGAVRNQELRPGAGERMVLNGTWSQKDCDDYEESTVARPMLNGQLMGNIVSFPILCLANAFCLWLTKCVGENKWMDPLAAKYLVNGDDGLVVTNQRGYQFWCRLASAMGFPPSVGKVYFSRDFCDFNSDLFMPRPECSISLGQFIHGNREYYRSEMLHRYIPVKRLDPRLVGQLTICRPPNIRIGLLYGLNRTGESVAFSELMGCRKGMTLRGVQMWLLENCKYSQQVQLMSYFHRYLLGKPQIFNLIKGIPWFLPCCLGGLGLRPLYNVRDVGRYAEPYKRVPLLTRRIIQDDDHPKGAIPEMLFGPSNRQMQTCRWLKPRMEIGEIDLPGKPGEDPIGSFQPPKGWARKEFSKDGEFDDDIGDISTDWYLWSHLQESSNDLDQYVDDKKQESFLERQKLDVQTKFYLAVVRYCRRLQKFWKENLIKSHYLPHDTLMSLDPHLIGDLSKLSVRSNFDFHITIDELRYLQSFETRIVAL